MKKIISLICCLLVLIPVLSISVSATVESSDSDIHVGNIFKNFDSFKYDSVNSGTSSFYSDLHKNEDLTTYKSILKRVTGFTDYYIIPLDDYLLMPYLLNYYTPSLSTYEDLYYVSFTTGGLVSNIQCFTIYSDSPIYLKDYGNYISFASDSDFFEYHHGGCYLEKNAKYSSSYYYNYGSFLDNSGTLHNDDFVSKLPLKYTSSTTSLCDISYFDSSYVSKLSERNYKSFQFENVYTNCDILDKSLLPNLTDNKLPSYNADGTTATFRDRFDIELNPEFSVNMTRNSEYFDFTITNNSSVPVQWVAYIIDENYDYPEYQNGKKVDYNDGCYDYKINDFTALFEHETPGSKWLYLSDEYYYTYNLDTISELGGFSYTYNMTLSKQFGSSCWHFLKTGGSYSDRVYWDNIGIQAKKNYSIRFRALPLPETFENASVLFDLDWMNDDNKDSFLDWHCSGIKKGFFSGALLDLSYDNSYYPKSFIFERSIQTFSYNFVISDPLKNVYLDSNDVQYIYQHEFSIVNNVPAFSSVKHDDSLSNISSGYVNDVGGLLNSVYKKNMETGDEQFINQTGNLVSSNGVDVDIDNVGLDDVKGYINQSKDFFILIQSVLICFPSWIWVLVCFGLTALIVIGIVKALL